MKYLIVLLFLIFAYASSANQKISELNLRLGNSLVFTENNKLIVSTGKIRRTYILTSEGLVTAEEKRRIKKQNSKLGGISELQSRIKL